MDDSPTCGMVLHDREQKGRRHRGRVVVGILDEDRHGGGARERRASAIDRQEGEVVLGQLFVVQRLLQHHVAARPVHNKEAVLMPC